MALFIYILSYNENENMYELLNLLTNQAFEMKITNEHK